MPGDTNDDSKFYHEGVLRFAKEFTLGVQLWMNFVNTGNENLMGSRLKSDLLYQKPSNLI